MTARRHTPRSLASFMFIAASIAIAIAGCGGSKSNSSVSTTTTTEPEPIAATVHIVDGHFDPETVEIAVGGSVMWINDEPRRHRLLSLDKGVIDSPQIKPNAAWMTKFVTIGEWAYYCTNHNTMKGTVIVR